MKSKPSDDIAVQIAVLIDSDPVMAKRIKEHVKPARLKELLGLDEPEPTTDEKQLPLGTPGK